MDLFLSVIKVCTLSIKGVLLSLKQGLHIQYGWTKSWEHHIKKNSTTVLRNKGTRSNYDMLLMVLALPVSCNH